MREPVKTVGELIAKLQELPPETKLLMWDRRWHVVDTLNTETTRDGKQLAVIYVRPEE